jgi:uncharacterized cupredoxin-like copper-binding protein
MKHYRLLSLSICLVSGLAGSSSAWAGGNHAGGHGHHDESPIGVPGTAAKVVRTISVEAGDNMRFQPSSIPVKQGETVRLVVKNVGQLKHEFSLGTEKELREHYEVMKKFPDMEHDEPNKVSLRPGQTGEVLWRFTKAGTVHFACLHPGHYDAGMKGQVVVAKK